MQQHQARTTQLVKRDPAEVAALRPNQPNASPPQLQAYHLATVAPRAEQVQVSLNNAATWRKFSRQNTEMIVTKAGRRMFPSLSLDIKGLDPAKKYEVYVTLLLADQRTLKYQRGLWIPNGPGETYPPPGCSAGLVYVHPDSPATGRQWCKQEVTFMKLKLTNKLDGFEDPGRNGTMIFAYSMHKYLPVVHISEVTSPATVKSEAVVQAAGSQDRFYTSVVFPGTEFITVTAYQNPELTDLKIQFNPYAKGIRNQTDRSSTIMIDSFRPTLQALQHRQHQPQHEPQTTVSAASHEQPQQLQQQQQQQSQQQQPPNQQLPLGFEFGAYPGQTASSYGHWQPQQSSSGSSASSTAAVAAASRRYRPYSLQQHQLHQPATAAVSSGDRLSESPGSQSGDLSAAAAASASSAAYYSSQYQQYYQPAHHLYYAQYYGLSSQDQQQHIEQPDAGSSFCASLTPPPPPQQQHQQQHQQLQHHQLLQHHHQHQLESPFLPLHQQSQASLQLLHPAHASLLGHVTTPQGCSALASSSHVTDSSPSGVSFSGQDL